MATLPNDAVPSVDAVAHVRSCDLGASAERITTTEAVQDDPRDARIAELSAELAANPITVRKERFERRLKAGRLTYADYKSLPVNIQRMYAQIHGAPLPENELRRIQNAKQRRTEKKKCARKSRNRNRR